VLLKVRPPDSESMLSDASNLTLGLDWS